MPMLSNLNVVAIAACVLLSMGLGFVWFSPVLFLGRWMKLAKIETKPAEEMRKTMPVCLAISFISCVMLSVAFAVLLQLLPAMATTVGAIKLALFLWVSFVATTFGPSYAYTGKPLELFFIDTGYPLAALLLIAVTLTTLGA